MAISPQSQNSASKVTTLWRFTNMLIIIIIIITKAPYDSKINATACNCKKTANASDFIMTQD